MMEDINKQIFELCDGVQQKLTHRCQTSTIEKKNGSGETKRCCKWLGRHVYNIIINQEC